MELCHVALSICAAVGLFGAGLIKHLLAAIKQLATDKNTVYDRLVMSEQEKIVILREIYEIYNGGEDE